MFLICVINKYFRYSMESKLEQLTQKLYEEGLSKGRAEAEELLSKARQDAERLVADARVQAERLLAEATAQSATLKENSENELRMASAQMVSELRQRIGEMVVAGVVAPEVSEAWSDGSFVRELVLASVARWDPRGDAAIEVILPEQAEGRLADDIRGSVAKMFGDGVQVTTSSRVKVPFRIAPKGAGYYVSFADHDFDTLLRGYLKPRVEALLYGAQSSSVLPSSLSSESSKL